MAMTDESTIWQQIELSESYLICSMYDEAAVLSSSILKSLLNDNTDVDQKAQTRVDDIELLHDLKESTAMVLVQSLNRLGRTAEILNELKSTFGAITDIPVQVVLTGVCLQITEGSLSGIREFLEEFLDRWSYVDEGYYVLEGEGADVSSVEDSFGGPSVLEVEKYLEVVEVYVFPLLGKALNDRDAAISWVEKSALPEESRQALLRRLSSLYSLEATNMSDSSYAPPSADSAVPTSKDLHKSGASPELFITKFPHPIENGDKSFLKVSRQVDSCFWLFRTISLKFGETRVVLSNGKMLLSCLVLIVIYIFRKKRATLLRVAARQASNFKKALVDLWELAFSYQVNPLAAVQPLSSAARGAHR